MDSINKIERTLGDVISNNGERLHDIYLIMKEKYLLTEQEKQLKIRKIVNDYILDYFRTIQNYSEEKLDSKEFKNHYLV